MPGVAVPGVAVPGVAGVVVLGSSTARRLIWSASTLLSRSWDLTDFICAVM